MLSALSLKSVSLALIVTGLSAGCAVAVNDDPGEPDPTGDAAVADAGHDARAASHDGGTPGADGTTPPEGDTGAPPVVDSSAPDTSVPITTTDASVPDANVPDANVPDVSVGNAVKPAQGELLITEVMYNPTTLEPDTEWFEITNTANGPRLLSGLSLEDGSGHSETIGTAPTIAAGAYVVLARNKASATGTAKVPAAAIVYQYATLTLANATTGSVTIKDGATVIAQSPYGNFAISSASATANSIQLKSLTYSSESTAGNWCLSKTTWASGSDNGSPGAALNCQ